MYWRYMPMGLYALAFSWDPSLSMSKGVFSAFFAGPFWNRHEGLAAAPFLRYLPEVLGLLLDGDSLESQVSSLRMGSSSRTQGIHSSLYSLFTCSWEPSKVMSYRKGIIRSSVLSLRSRYGWASEACFSQFHCLGALHQPCKGIMRLPQSLVYAF
jgi:hypothetical protein